MTTTLDEELNKKTAELDLSDTFENDKLATNHNGTTVADEETNLLNNDKQADKEETIKEQVSNTTTTPDNTVTENVTETKSTDTPTDTEIPTDPTDNMTAAVPEQEVTLSLPDALEQCAKDEYLVKTIDWKNKKVRIITQNGKKPISHIPYTNICYREWPLSFGGYQ